MKQWLNDKFLFYPIRYLRGEYIKPLLKEVQCIERLPLSEIRTYQIGKLNKLIDYSINYIPFYKRNLSQMLNKGKLITSLMDIERLPIVTRQMLKDNLSDFQSSERLRISRRSTSGSTGQPLTFYKDRHASAYMDAVMYHSYSWHGISIGAPQARFWGMPLGKKDKYIMMLTDFVMNRIRLSAFDLKEHSMEKFYEKFLYFKPQYLYGYPSLINEFAVFMKKHNLKLHNVELKGFIHTGELPISNQIHSIESIFQIPAINEYGCTEVGVIAFQCKNKRLHLMSSNIVVEVLNGGQQVLDQEGILYVTELNSRYMPFIRYELGDRAIYHSDKCACGLEMPTIGIIEGRIDDYIDAPDGSRIYDAIFAYTLKKGIEKFKVIQTAVDNIDIYVVRSKDFSDDLKDSYIKKLSSYFNNSIHIHMKFVNSIEHHKSGKFRYFEKKF